MVGEIGRRIELEMTKEPMYIHLSTDMCLLIYCLLWRGSSRAIRLEIMKVNTYS